jgi:hypothetical protein
MSYQLTSSAPSSFLSTRLIPRYLLSALLRYPILIPRHHRLRSPMPPISPDSIYQFPIIPRLSRKPRRLYYLQIPRRNLHQTIRTDPDHRRITSNKSDRLRTTLRLPLPTLLSTITRHISRRRRNTSQSHSRFDQLSQIYRIDFESFETSSAIHSRICRSSILILRHSSHLLDTLSNEQRLLTKTILAISYGQKNAN